MKGFVLGALLGIPAAYFCASVFVEFLTGSDPLIEKEAKGQRERECETYKKVLEETTSYEEFLHVKRQLAHFKCY